MFALGHKPTYALQKGTSALPPIATAKADFPQPVMSALPPKADMCSALAHVCFGPIADLGHSRSFSDHLRRGQKIRIGLRDAGNQLIRPRQEALEQRRRVRPAIAKHQLDGWRVALQRTNDH